MPKTLLSDEERWIIYAPGFVPFQSLFLHHPFTSLRLLFFLSMDVHLELNCFQTTASFWTVDMAARSEIRHDKGSLAKQIAAKIEIKALLRVLSPGSDLLWQFADYNYGKVKVKTRRAANNACNFQLTKKQMICCPMRPEQNTTIERIMQLWLERAKRS